MNENTILLQNIPLSAEIVTKKLLDKILRDLDRLLDNILDNNALSSNNNEKTDIWEL